MKALVLAFPACSAPSLVSPPPVDPLRVVAPALASIVRAKRHAKGVRHG